MEGWGWSGRGCSSSEGGDGSDFVFGSGGLESPKIRRSERRKSLRTLSSRGRFPKSGPKSPLMRMAEMRKRGLRGRALHQSGKKGSFGAESRSNKGFAKRGRQVLNVIPEGDEVAAGSVEVLDEEGVRGSGRVQAGEDAVMVEGLVSGEVGTLSEGESAEKGCPIQPWKKESVQAGASLDLALDILAAQPLQEMGFIGEQVNPAVVGDGKNELLLLGSKQMEGIVISTGVDLDEEYPLLSKESLSATRGKDRNRGTGGNEGLMGPEDRLKGIGGKSKEAQNGGHSSKVDGHKGIGNKNYKASLSDVVSLGVTCR